MNGERAGAVPAASLSARVGRDYDAEELTVRGPSSVGEATHRLELLADRMGDVSKKLEDLADRAFGSRPEAAINNEAVHPPYGGRFAELWSATDRVDYLLGRIEASAQRLDGIA